MKYFKTYIYRVLPMLMIILNDHNLKKYGINDKDTFRLIDKQKK